jgi:light-regulated signal transduction histidine kinase (bacteriophytochrome)
MGMGAGSHLPMDVIEGAEFVLERLQQGEIIQVEDVRSALAASPVVQFGQPLGIRAVLILPLMVQDEAIGVLGFGAETPGAFTPEHIEIAGEVADELALAIKQALLGMELQRHTAELERQAQELERSNAELQQFAYVASHDLQEPLRMVTSYLQLLERRYKNRLDPDADDFIAFAVEGAARMHELIRGLLDYSRIGTHGMAFQATDLSLILGQVLDSLQVAVRESGAIVTSDPLPVVMADATQMSQLLQNLLGNAIKFHGDGPPEIHVGAQRRNGGWCFSVRDNGIGLEPRYAERIFVIFQRLHTRDRYPGTGIGLSICKRIVERHGGRIWVESEPGQGSTFHFSLPDGSGS